MSEPLSSSHNCFGDKQSFKYSEFDILDKFLSYLAKKKIKNKIVILPHPSEKKGKYSKILAKYADKLKLIPPNSQNLIEEIAKASLVVGMQGMALIVACLCDKTAISFIPDSNTDCSLPFDNILKIKRVEELNKILWKKTKIGKFV